jgi:hypothetical protein
LRLVKLACWVAYTVWLLTIRDIDLCPNSSTSGDSTLKLMDLLMGKSEDVINSTFQVILYIFIFKMINVYNIARCDTVQELKKQNG